MNCAVWGFELCLWNLKGKKGWIAALVRLVKLAKAEQIDVIHTSLLVADLLGLVTGWLTKIPVIVTLVNATYGPEWVDDNPVITKWKHRTFMSLYRLFIRLHCTEAMAISEAVKHHAVQHLQLPPEKITVIYRSLDPVLTVKDEALVGEADARLSHLKSELGIERLGPILLNVARIVPNKGQVFLLEAVARLKWEYPRIKLLIAGEITTQLDLAGVRDELGLQDHVSLLGYRSDVRDLHRSVISGSFLLFTRVWYGTA